MKKIENQVVGDENAAEVPNQVDEATREKIEAVRAQVRASFAKIAMSMMALSRYRHQSIADLQALVLDPLLQDRIAMAYATGAKPEVSDTAGIAIWASVSQEVDTKIREQIRAGVFPIRLKTQDWASGDINWIFDVITPDQATTARVLANFKQVVKEGDLRLHPLVARLVDKETLAKLGASATEAPTPGQRVN